VLGSELGMAGPERFVVLSNDGSPACLLSFVEGVAADKVIAAGTLHIYTALYYF
jgi:hypothetical protein